MTDQEALIVEAQAGDRGSLHRLLVPLQMPVLGFLRRFVEQTDAHDIAQETFVLVVQKIKQFEFKSSFRAWVFRIAFRQMINFQKSQSRTSCELLEQDVSDQRVAPSALESDEQAHLIQEVIHQLPEHQRQVVWLRIREDLTFREIAEICGEPLNTILSRMHQAKKNLLRMFQSAGIESGVLS